jgi:histone acetyltransferase (RNA polymerase elongator complex component)
MWGRMEQLLDIGHTIDKLEVIVLGGTWASYPHEYQEEFIRDMYYSANTFWDPTPRRDRHTLEEEKLINRNSISKVIGVTLETRPDTITPDEIIRFRKYGCTRVQLGIQHFDGGILKKINRRCTYEQTIAAIALLKDWGYKVDGHFMPNLPGATPEVDEKMFKTLLNHTSQEVTTPLSFPISKWTLYNVENEDVQIDQWKIYPCEVVPFTVIEKWYKAGEYKPYEESHLSRMLIETKRNVFPWIRLNRIIRDIPLDYIMASGDHPNMRQSLQDVMRRNGYKCKCIRCREVKLGSMSIDPIYIVRQYNGSRGIELFISCESSDESVIYGFVRLRIPNSENPNGPFTPNTNQHAWIRELHVYGKIQVTSEKYKAVSFQSTSTETGTAQHKGIGSKLMECAEDISKSFGKHHLYVISGEGTKNYYSRIGYTESIHGYMFKNLE